MTQADKRRNIITDLLIGMGIPVLSIALCKPRPHASTAGLTDSARRLVLPGPPL